VETDGSWVFDFYHPSWRDYRKTGLPYGYRIEVHKQSGKAEHFATLQRQGATSRAGGARHTGKGETGEG
jgi:hypothetical protein